MKMFNITRDTPFTFELVDKEGIRLMYRLQPAVGKNEKEKEKEKS
jgi:hypothetical protein